MTPHKDKLIRRLAEEWIRKVGEDIRAAEALLEKEYRLLYPSCFHAQQLAEKFMKALLTLRQVEFSKTYSIRELLELIHTFDENTAVKLQSAVSLTPYGVEARYPGDAPEPTLAETKKALALARLVEDAVRKLIRQSA